MKKKKTGVWRVLLSHLVLVLAAAMLTFFILDRFNEAMAFLNNPVTKWMLAVFALAAMALAVTDIVRAGIERKRGNAAPADKGGQHEKE